ncbi:hypothetical protein AMAG_14770 [Allomyces macrogynus ATCC 38327]|uniref:Uncharacterized protein n=1 Tax=Allomyces macrogynus (strain ATCC 38327) TaxID=578462 RepID=A0A0L0T542_ALLM3|nr:hypothetical protein AMAG_14770 [Allomyces macrogynus ATCC 38327]|eukprot:KNE69923.1 hypothetical protein AMAG_14770 [Allomyces macrogynus ATCC 38327]
MENTVLTLEQLHQWLYNQFNIDVTKETIVWYLCEENFVLKQLMHKVVTMNSPEHIAKHCIWCE